MEHFTSEIGDAKDREIRGARHLHRATRSGFFSLLIGLQCFLFAGDASADTFFVAPTETGGNDSNDGSAQTPWATIDHGLTRIQGGDEIVVRDGIYEGAIYHAGGFSDWITVRAEHPYRAKLTNATAGGTVLFLATKGPAKIIVEGFLLSNAHPSYTCPNGREANFVVHIENAQDVVFRNNIVFGNNAPGTCNELLKINRGGDDQYPKNIQIQGNLFYDHANAGGADMIDSVRPGELDILDNIFFARDAPEAQSFITLKRQIDPSTVAGGITPRSPRFKIYRNVFLNYSGKTDQAFIQLGEDGYAEVMISDALIENNLLIGNSPHSMAAPFQLKGVRNITVRANTVVGDLPGSAYGLRIGTEVNNLQVRDIAITNNIWSDASGTMGDRFINTYNDVDISTIVLDNNQFWNGGNPLPSTESPPPSADQHRVEADPLLANVPSDILLPVWDEQQHVFPSGNNTIRQELQRLVEAYAAIAETSPAVNAAAPGQMPADDILGRIRDANPDIGAFEFLAPLPDAGLLMDAGGDHGAAVEAGSAPPIDAGEANGDSIGRPPADDGCGCEVHGARGLKTHLWTLLVLCLCLVVRRFGTRRPIGRTKPLR